VKVNDGLLAGGAEEEGAVGAGVHEEVFGEDGGAGGAPELLYLQMLLQPLEEQFDILPLVAYLPKPR